MVAFFSSRRQFHRSSRRTPLDTLGAHVDALPESMLHVVASHRAMRDVVIRKGPDGAIERVRIGRWRVLTADGQRRLAEVRELGCQRVAIRIERFADQGGHPSSEIWQLYNLEGRLEAAMQTTPDGKFAMLTNYRTRQAFRLAANAAGELVAVETWKI